METPRRLHQRPTPPVPPVSGWRPSCGFLSIAFVLTVGGLAYLFLSFGGPDDAATTALPPPAGETFATWTPPALRAPPAARLVPEEGADPTRDLTHYLARGEKPTMPEVIERLHQAGVHTGIGAFSPPGTSPPMVGIAVPEDFVLPKGYVRHYQATDDGQSIEAILMYSPDHQLVDAANRPIAIPKNRVVPPEQVPPGLSIKRIVIPEPIEPR